QIEIGAVGSKGIITGCADLFASLPPAVLTANDTSLQGVIELGTGTNAAVRRFDAHPIACTDATRASGIRVHFDLRIAPAPPQARQAAVLALAEQRVFRAREHEGRAFSQLRPRPRTHERSAKSGSGG